MEHGAHAPGRRLLFLSPPQSRRPNGAAPNRRSRSARGPLPRPTRTRTSTTWLPRLRLLALAISQPQTTEAGNRQSRHVSRLQTTARPWLCRPPPSHCHQTKDSPWRVPRCHPHPNATPITSAPLVGGHFIQTTNSYLPLSSVGAQLVSSSFV